MKKRNQTIASLALAALLLVGLAACSGEDGGKEPETTNPTETPTDVPSTGAGWVNGELTLTVPSEYTDLVLVDMPQDDPDGVLYNVREKASAEAGAADGHDASWGDGWLFGIRRVSEDALHEMLCWDMSGAEVFARDAEGDYYVFTHPTDVRLYRQNSEEYEKASEQWTALNEWAWDDVRRDFLAENTGLTAFTRGNSMLDMYLARAAYRDDADYVLSTTDYGPLAPNGVDAVPYVERLMDYTACEDADLSETPDGEYVVFSYPADDVRFDFFRMDGKKNYVRMVWSGDNEQLMKLSYADDTEATEVMQAWYDEVVAANDLGNAALGYTADDLVGRWAEKIAGRGVITIEKAGDATYSVSIDWPGSAFERGIWEMTATPEGEGGALRYENAKHYVRTFTSDTEYTDEVVYEDGSGLFYLNSANEIMWEDHVNDAGADCVFISVD